MITEEEYAQQIAAMSAQIKAFRAQNPDTDPRVRFNFPPDTALLGVTVTDCMREGLITANAHGWAMISAALHGFPDEREPTPLMLRCAIETCDFAADLVPSPCPSCGFLMRSLSKGPHAPRPGIDPIICSDCLAVNILGPDYRLRAPTAEEIAALRMAGAWDEIQEAIAEVRAKKKRP